MKVYNIMKHQRIYLCMLLLLGTCAICAQHTYSYTKDHPLVIVCDWDKAPYEFLDDHGHPSGSNVDVLNVILDKLHIPHKFVMKDWTNAVKTFERADADLIFANVNRFKGKGYFATQIINYNRIRVAMTRDTTDIISMKTLEEEGVILKSGDYTTLYFRDVDSAYRHKIEYQSPKVALTSLLSGDGKYFVWGEEPLKWKIRILNLEGIVLNDVSIPVSEVHIIGRDKELIDQIDDQFSRLKQSGDLETILNKWLHPERMDNNTSYTTVYIILGILLLSVLIILFNRLARQHVNRATRSMTELNRMMNKALHMGNFDVMLYDIDNDRMTNQYGEILPATGLTLDEFAAHIHPDQQQEFRQKIQLLLSGRERKFVLNKRWNAGTAENPKWLVFQGHAVCELDSEGRPRYIINAVHDVTHEMEEDMAARNLVHKYDRLVNIPFVAMSFYNKDGWLIEANDTMKELCGMNESIETQRFWEQLCMFDVPLFRKVYSPEDRNDLFVCQHMYYPEIELDKYIEFSIHPLFDTDGAIVNYLVTAYDITDERDREMERIHSDREIERIKEQIEQQSRQLDFMEQLCHCRLLGSGETVDTIRQDGRRYEQRGDFAFDVTEITQKREQLEKLTAIAQQSTQLKSGFMASMTHELRTPLNAIIGFTSILESIEPSEERAEYVRIIRNSSDMLQRLINDIIEASSLTEGHVSIQRADVNFSTAFNDICMTLRQRIQNPQISFLFDNPYESFYTSVDIERIQQLYTNFVTNAVKFTKEGHIRIGYRYERHGLYLYCEDTGIGIPQEKQEIIFNRFVKLDEFVQGTGMGLNICKSIVESSHGQIGVDSEGVGKGSTFWCWIPCERKLSSLTV